MRNDWKLVRPAALLAAFAFSLAACGGGDDAGGKGGEKGATADSGAAAPAAGADSAGAAGGQPSAPKGPTGPVANVPPNELGRIMVLEYHRLLIPGEKEGEFIRTRENFQKDLQALYERGYRPVTMRQVMDGDIDLPAGTSPVVFTIDDASRGQFYYRPDGSIDPNSMVGMWEAFGRQNPAWSGGAVWCILPAAGHPSNFFSEKPDRQYASRQEREANIKKKVDYLVQNGHEVCNHTLYHARLDKARDDAQAQEWIGRGEDSIKVYLPADYDIVTFALPLGMWPKNHALAWRGSWNGKPYENRVVLEVSGGPNVSPFDRRWDPHSVDRFIVAPGALERQLKHWDEDPSNRYVSDGDPRTVSYPRGEEGNLNRARLGGRTARALDNAAPAAGAAPAGGAAPAAGAQKQ